MILRDGKKINVEDGRVEIVVDGKTRKLIFKVGRNLLVTVMTMCFPTTSSSSSSSSSSSPTRTPTSRTRERYRARQTKILPLVNSKWLVSSNDHYEQ